MTQRPHAVGILCGSGPEAGIDLWQAVLDETRRAAGDRYRGDMDAPATLVVSDPRLGASMDLPSTAQPVRAALIEGAAQLAATCDRWAIACNTLNVFVDDIEASGHGRGLVPFQTAVAAAVAAAGTPVTVLGARPVASMGSWSPYEQLEGAVPLDSDRIEALHELILDAKRIGLDHPSLPGRLDRLIGPSGDTTFVLACTELPPIATRLEGRRWINPTVEVARQLVIG